MQNQGLSSSFQTPATRPGQNPNAGDPYAANQADEGNASNYDRSMDQQDPRDTRVSGGRRNQPRDTAMTLEPDTST